MINFKKEIKAIKTRSFPGRSYTIPKPSSRFIPNWYKEIPAYRKLEDTGQNLETIKKCIPVLDSLCLGYMIETIEDVYYDEDSKLFNPSKMLSLTHPDFQVNGYPIEDQYHKIAYKWENFIYLKPPKGYSLLFIHPLHRMDLPFYSLPGLVDSDVYPISVVFPFFMKKGFSGVIPKGTPIVQVIPIKRDSWKIKEYNKTIEVDNPHMLFEKYNHDYNKNGLYLKNIRKEKGYE